MLIFVLIWLVLLLVASIALLWIPVEGNGAALVIVAVFFLIMGNALAMAFVIVWVMPLLWHS
jgi:hypothetical protein